MTRRPVPLVVGDPRPAIACALALTVVALITCAGIGALTAIHIHDRLRGGTP